MIKLAFCLSVQFGVRTQGNVLWFVWSLNICNFFAKIANMVVLVFPACQNG